MKEIQISDEAGSGNAPDVPCGVLDLHRIFALVK